MLLQPEIPGIRKSKLFHAIRWHSSQSQRWNLSRSFLRWCLFHGSLPFWVIKTLDAPLSLRRERPRHHKYPTTSSSHTTPSMAITTFALQCHALVENHSINHSQRRGNCLENIHPQRAGTHIVATAMCLMRFACCRVALVWLFRNFHKIMFIDECLLLLKRFNGGGGGLCGKIASPFRRKQSSGCCKIATQSLAWSPTHNPSNIRSS